MVISGEGTPDSPLRLGVRHRTYATANRPDPGDAGEGCMIYDSDINKPIWSDGATWRDATGSAV